MVKDKGCGGRDEAIRPAGDEVTPVTAGGSPLRTPKMPNPLAGDEVTVVTGGWLIVWHSRDNATMTLCDSGTLKRPFSGPSFHTRRGEWHPDLSPHGARLFRG